MCYNTTIEIRARGRPFPDHLLEGSDHMGAGRPRRFKSVKALEDAWEEYKAWCNSQTVLTHAFDPKSARFISRELKHGVTYTVEGFCVWAGLARSNFYETYAEDERFRDIVTRMKEECEIDARMKFELGVIDPRLAALWMSKHGYSTKTESNVSGAVPVVISGDDELED